ncbi:MAG: HEAT repeat domain-containing protein [Bryobacteraceae bacterium]
MKTRSTSRLKACSALLLGSAICFGQQNLDATQERARDILIRSVEEKNPDTRREAVFAVSLVGAHEKVTSQLATMLEQDKDVPVRVAVVSCLGDFKDPTLTPTLEKALKDAAPEVGFAASMALFRLKQPIGKETLVSMLTGQSKTSSSFVTAQKRGAFRMLQTPTKLFMTVAAAAVPIPGFGLGMASAQGILSDPGASARASVVLMLENETDAETQNAIKAALSDKEWSVRAAAVHALQYAATRR